MADDDPFSIFPYRWPLPNSGNSWSVPRIRMPDFFGFQHDMQQDSWVYDGHGVDATGRLWHLFFTFGRMSFGSRAASGQPVYAVVPPARPDRHKPTRATATASESRRIRGFRRR